MLILAHGCCYFLPHFLIIKEALKRQYIGHLSTYASSLSKLCVRRRITSESVCWVFCCGVVFSLSSGTFCDLSRCELVSGNCVSWLVWVVSWFLTGSSVLHVFGGLSRGRTGFGLRNVFSSSCWIKSLSLVRSGLSIVTSACGWAVLVVFIVNKSWLNFSSEKAKEVWVVIKGRSRVWNESQDGKKLREEKFQKTFHWNCLWISF